jgi:hypothetical protein
MNYDGKNLKAFILWALYPNYFFPQALPMTAVSIIGGCMSAYYNHTSELTLYLASKVEGQVK